PVEPFRPLATDHDVVATLGVVVAVAGTADQDVVAAPRVVEEPVAVVTLEQVVAEAALDPVVALVAPEQVRTGRPLDEVVVEPGKDLSPVRTGQDPVRAAAADEQVVEARATVDRVVAGLAEDPVL